MAVSSHTADDDWAQWTASTLEDNGYRTFLRAWDQVPGSVWPSLLDEALRTCDRLLLLISPDYVRSVGDAPEWQGLWNDDPAGIDRRIVPVLVRPTKVRGLVASRTPIDLTPFASSGSQPPGVASDAATKLLVGLDASWTGRFAPGLRPSPIPAPTLPAASPCPAIDQTTAGGVILCHSDADRAQAGLLRARLRGQGVAAWTRDADLLPGSRRRHGVETAVEESRHVLVLLSHAAASETGDYQRHVLLALDQDATRPPGTNFLVPVRLEACPMPHRLRDHQPVDLYQPGGFDALSAALRFDAASRQTPQVLNADVSRAYPSGSKRSTHW